MGRISKNTSIGIKNTKSPKEINSAVLVEVDMEAAEVRDATAIDSLGCLKTRSEESTICRTSHRTSTATPLHLRSNSATDARRTGNRKRTPFPHRRTAKRTASESNRPAKQRNCVQQPRRRHVQATPTIAPTPPRPLQSPMPRNNSLYGFNGDNGDIVAPLHRYPVTRYHFSGTPQRTRNVLAPKQRSTATAILTTPTKSTVARTEKTPAMSSIRFSSKMMFTPLCSGVVSDIRGVSNTGGVLCAGEISNTGVVSNKGGMPELGGLSIKGGLSNIGCISNARPGTTGKHNTGGVINSGFDAGVPNTIRNLPSGGDLPTLSTALIVPTHDRDAAKNNTSMSANRVGLSAEAACDGEVVRRWREFDSDEINRRLQFARQDKLRVAGALENDYVRELRRLNIEKSVEDDEKWNQQTGGPH